MKSSKEKYLGRLFLCLVLAEVLLILVSWLINAAAPELPVHSLLGNEGIRWLFGHFISNMLKPLLVWLVLLCIAYGCLHDSGLWAHLRSWSLHSSPVSYRQRLAFQFVLTELIFFVIILLLLTCVPHAVLLSVTGYLFPGTFAQSIIPILIFIVVVCSLTYGAISGTMTGFSQACHALGSGFSTLALLFPFYILVIEFYESVRFVFFHTS